MSYLLCLQYSLQLTILSLCRHGYKKWVCLLEKLELFSVKSRVFPHVPLKVFYQGGILKGWLFKKLLVHR